MTLLETGKITRAHGIAGEVRIEPWTDSIEDLLELTELYLKDGTKLIVKSSRPHKTCVLVKFKRINTIEEAMPLINQVVYLDKDSVELSDGQYFIADLLGVLVSDIDSGEVYGKITYVQNTGANDVYHITREHDKKLFLIPAIPSVVREVDIQEKTMRIFVLEGLFD